MRKWPNSDSPCIADRLLERDRRLRAAHDLLDLLELQIEIDRDLEGQRLAAELGAQLPLRAHDLVQLLDDVPRHADGARLVRQRACNRLADPPGRIRRELEALAVVELLRGANQADRPLLNQIEERQPLVTVTLRDRNDETQIRLHHLLLRTMVATLDPLRQLDLLRRRQQFDLADLLQKELQRVGRNLARLCDQLIVLDEECADDGIRRVNRPDRCPGRRQDVTGAVERTTSSSASAGGSASFRISCISFTCKSEREGSVPLYIRALVETQRTGVPPRRARSNANLLSHGS